MNPSLIKVPFSKQNALNVTLYIEKYDDMDHQMLNYVLEGSSQQSISLTHSELIEISKLYKGDTKLGESFYHWGSGDIWKVKLKNGESGYSLYESSDGTTIELTDKEFTAFIDDFLAIEVGDEKSS